MTEHEIIKYAVYNAIGVGKENASTRKQIAERAGCNDRNVRSIIQELRTDNYVIVQTMMAKDITSQRTLQKGERPRPIGWPGS